MIDVPVNQAAAGVFSVFEHIKGIRDLFLPKGLELKGENWTKMAERESWPTFSSTFDDKLCSTEQEKVDFSWLGNSWEEIGCEEYIYSSILLIRQAG